MSRVFNSCNSNDSNDPMDCKFSGQRRRGESIWKITIISETRPWIVIQELSGNCEGWYDGVCSSSEISNAGLSDYDYGQQTVLPNIKESAGESYLGEFDCSDTPTDGGYEWRTTFGDIIWDLEWCLSDNKVVESAGGFTNGCGGND